MASSSRMMHSAAAVQLTDEYVQDRARPDRAIDALDEACAHTHARTDYPPAVAMLVGGASGDAPWRRRRRRANRNGRRASRQWTTIPTRSSGSRARASMRSSDLAPRWRRRSRSDSQIDGARHWRADGLGRAEQPRRAIPGRQQRRHARRPSHGWLSRRARRVDPATVSRGRGRGPRSRCRAGGRGGHWQQCRVARPVRGLRYAPDDRPLQGPTPESTQL